MRLVARSKLRAEVDNIEVVGTLRDAAKRGVYPARLGRSSE
jgi:hypothetical protein